MDKRSELFVEGAQQHQKALLKAFDADVQQAQSKSRCGPFLREGFHRHKACWGGASLQLLGINDALIGCFVIRRGSAPLILSKLLRGRAKTNQGAVELDMHHVG